MKPKKFIKLLGTSLLFTSFIVIALTFITAYNNESKTILIDINSIGEANFEIFVLFPITTISGTLAFYFIISDETRGRKNQHKNNLYN